ncbi:hypothetical protein L211DRAFT_61502 [Terfezia boudieri ATCC MYA-4762]|uniref:Uncharacterized protein n=1 Tax=Terfezia boudieri ATCC MYA-4762 TaxID=1051890 RepID=A0A3N4LYW6_9PEZI|nr:hypothetical protein L211DRAFT_61502 [Terfezia boudieri ATCC MYA-4762]
MQFIVPRMYRVFKDEGMWLPHSLRLHRRKKSFATAYQHRTAIIFNQLRISTSQPLLYLTNFGVSPNYGFIAIQDCCGILGSMWYDSTLFVRPIVQPPGQCSW